MDCDEVINRLKSEGWIDKLKKQEVTTEDIRDAIYENNCPR